MSPVQVSPTGGNLWVLHLAVSSNGNTAGAPLLEFVIHNGVDYDKRADGVYRVQALLAKQANRWLL